MERDNTLRPLMVQSDRTMLLDVHSPSADECRRDIIAFSSLVKSPEHIHTYELTSLSLWNAVSLGLGEKEIIERLRKWSRYDLDNRVLFFISDTVDRYGKLKLEEYDDGDYRLSVQNAILFVKLKSDSTVMKYLTAGGGDNSFLLEKIYRGKIKAELIKRGYPVTDTIPLTNGGPLDVKLKEDVTLRDYQKAARDSFVASGGYGTVVLPCGSGKTVVGMAVM